MVKVPKFKPRSGVTTDEVPEGDHTAIIRDVGVETLQREKREYDPKAKAKVVVYNDDGDAVMEDYQILRFVYEITDIEGAPRIGQLVGLSMNPGDKKDDYRMRSKLYKNCVVLDEVPKDGEELDTDAFINRKVEIKVVGKRGTSGNMEWANVDGPILRVLDGGKQASFERDAMSPEMG